MSVTHVLQHIQTGEYLQFLIAPSRWANRPKVIREIHTRNIHLATTLADLMDKKHIADHFVNLGLGPDYRRVEVKVLSVRALQLMRRPSKDLEWS